MFFPWRKLFMVGGTKIRNSEIQLGWSHTGHTRSKWISQTHLYSFSVRMDSTFKMTNCVIICDGVILNTLKMLRVLRLTNTEGVYILGTKTLGQSGSTWKLMLMGRYCVSQNTKNLQDNNQNLKTNTSNLGSSVCLEVQSFHFFPVRLFSCGLLH